MKGEHCFHKAGGNSLFSTLAPDQLINDAVNNITNQKQRNKNTSLLYAQTVWDKLLQCSTGKNEAQIEDNFQRVFSGDDQFVSALSVGLELIVVNERITSICRFISNSSS